MNLIEPKLGRDRVPAIFCPRSPTATDRHIIDLHIKVGHASAASEEARPPQSTAD
jgi:hypothetical protein